MRLRSGFPAAIVLVALAAIVGRPPCWCKHASPTPKPAPAPCCGGHDSAPAPSPGSGCHHDQVSSCCLHADALSQSDREEGGAAGGDVGTVDFDSPGREAPPVPSTLLVRLRQDRHRSFAGPIHLKLRTLLI